MITPQQACYFAHQLTRQGEVGELDQISSTLFDSKVDLNPHQVDAALFALANPLQKGVVLADEVGLGKTIEAGLVLCQRWAERKRKLLVVAPAHIRKQWQSELSEKFNLPSVVLDRRAWNKLRQEGNPNPFDCGKIAIVSYGFASRMKEELRSIAFDLVVLDEAHKLRNAYQPSRKGGQAIRWAFELRQKLLLTATPLQNSLLELYGLGWFNPVHWLR
jgi:SNF2 family DNA or RNA helicase